jgi:hypothetical protein
MREKKVVINIGSFPVDCVEYLVRISALRHFISQTWKHLKAAFYSCLSLSLTLCRKNSSVKETVASEDIVD